MGIFLLLNFQSMLENFSLHNLQMILYKLVVYCFDLLMGAISVVSVTVEKICFFEGLCMTLWIFCLSIENYIN